MTCSLGAVPGTKPQPVGVCTPYSTGLIPSCYHLFTFIEWLCEIFDFRKKKTAATVSAMVFSTADLNCHGGGPRLAKSVNAEVWAVYFLSMCLRWENWGGQERHGATGYSFNNSEANMYFFSHRSGSNNLH